MSVEWGRGRKGGRGGVGGSEAGHCHTQGRKAGCATPRSTYGDVGRPFTFGFTLQRSPGNERERAAQDEKAEGEMDDDVPIQRKVRTRFEPVHRKPPPTPTA